MRTPMLARPTVARLTLFVTTAMLLAACAGETTSPTATRLVPTDANKALVQADDKTYTFFVDPNSSQTLSFGKSHLDLPANSICDIAKSEYGPTYWNSPCHVARRMVLITATVKDAHTNKPRVDFEPALRFNPYTNVQLSLFVSDTETLNNVLVLKYCSSSSHCVDESLTDASLGTTVNKSLQEVSRRIKHFSGYVVSE